jgi:RNA polymerase sigma-70 factor, ECF subfamily
VFYHARPAEACEAFLVSDSVDERDLVEKAKSDPEAFGLLYEQYVDRIYSYVYYRTGSHHDAEDLTAQVFVQALKNIRRYEHRGPPFTSWLYRIAHNAVANWHRDESRHQMVALDETVAVGASREESSYQRVTSNERRDLLLAAISHLPAERQDLLIFKFVEQLPNAQIGELLGRSEAAIKSLYHRTLLSLREDLGALGLEP